MRSKFTTEAIKNYYFEMACHDYTLEGDGSNMGFENNERLLKSYKSHCDANIFDGKYIMALTDGTSAHLPNTTTSVQGVPQVLRPQHL